MGSARRPRGMTRRSVLRDRCFAFRACAIDVGKALFSKCGLRRDYSIAVLVLRHCYCACENMPNTRPWVGQTNLQLSDLHVYSLAGLGEHTHAMHDPRPPRTGQWHCALQRAQRPHRTHAAAQRVSATQEARGDTRTHGLAPPPRRTDLTAHNAHPKHNRLDGTDRSQRPQAQRAWTERTANNAHIKHNRFGRNGSHPRGPRRPPARESQTAMTPPQPPHL